MIKIARRKIKIAIISFFLTVCTFFIFLSIWLSNLSPEDLLNGATSHSFIFPHYIFKIYIKIANPVPRNYHSSTGLPAIQFVANGRQGGDSTYDADCLEMIDYLIKNGADINEASKDKLGLTPLHLALLNKDLQLADLLIKNGADPNAKASGIYTGMTPIRFADELKKSKNSPSDDEIVSLLRKNGGKE
jgi:hypothetical protein